MEVSNSFSLCHFYPLPLGSQHYLDLAGLLPAKQLMGDGCRGVVKHFVPGFDKANGSGPQQCFIKRTDL